MNSFENKNYIAADYDYNQRFFDDVLDLFLGLASGHVGKYIYGDSAASTPAEPTTDCLWQQIIKQNDSSYYMPKADNDLLEQALLDISDFVPNNATVVDFGVGSVGAFNLHLRPFLNKLLSTSYIGVDYCKEYLDALDQLVGSPDLPEIRTIEMDFFETTQTSLTQEASLGIMTCSTIGNIYGTLRETAVDLNLTRSLRNISSLTKNGWLLLSVDTNQDKKSLGQGYIRPIMSKLFLTVFHRLYKELPTTGFDPTLFNYTPEWHPELQLFAHIATATEDQNFSLGTYNIEVRRGQKFHLLNSYKFKPSFFEACCEKANLKVLRVWHHESPMKLYLLADRANPIYNE